MEKGDRTLRSYSGSGISEIASQSVLVELSSLRALVASGKCTCELLEAIDKRLREIRMELGLPQGGGTTIGSTEDGGGPTK